MSLIESLNWRYATKRMSGDAVAEEKVQQIIQAASLAPTSSGLQPFKIILVTNEALKQQVSEAAYGQAQIVDASHVLIFAAWDKYTQERIDQRFSFMNAERNLPDSATDDYRKSLSETLLAKSDEEAFHHAAKQAYISFGIAIAEAALLRVDATPMEGFDPAKLDAVLGLGAQGLRSTTILPLGFRHPEGDWLQGLKKVRVPYQDFVIEFR